MGFSWRSAGAPKRVQRGICRGPEGGRQMMMMMMMMISPFGQCGLWASSQGCGMLKHTTADARLRGLSGGRQTVWKRSRGGE